MKLEEPQDGGKGEMKRKNRTSKATRQLSHRAGAHGHCATPSQRLGDMLPRKRKHGTETDRQTDMKTDRQIDGKVCRNSTQWVESS